MSQTGRILVAEDQPRTRERLCEALRALGFEVIAAEDGSEAVRLLETEKVDLVLSDHRMPRMTGLELLRTIGESRDIPVILYSAGSGSDVVFRAGQLGAVRFLDYPFRISEQLLPTITDALARKPATGSEEVRGADRLTGNSEATRHVREAVRRVARSNATVLITGETGTGKDVVARALHEESGREPFCALAITELAESLLESELFGHERGAFTGANTARPGLFEEADGGTLFLDEIGDAPLTVQAKLLRVMESGEVRRIGENRSRKVEPRMIFATNRDLAADVQANRFREDLFYRLNQVTIRLAPLRERSEDIEPLARAFFADLAEQAQLPTPEGSPAFWERLCAQPWHGNARELRATVQRLLLWWDASSILEPEHLREALVASQSHLSAEERDECQRMLEAYRRAGGNQEAARRALDMTRAAWRHRWDRYELADLSRRKR